MSLKATKTSLYKLVTEYASPPIMKKTEFVKAPRRPSYWLRWRMDGVSFDAYFSVCAGTPLLVIETSEYDEDSGQHKTASRVVYRLTVEGLRQRGMIADKLAHPHK